MVFKQCIYSLYVCMEFVVGFLSFHEIESSQVAFCAVTPSMCECFVALGVIKKLGLWDYMLNINIITTDCLC
ncbi:hypothetical protein SDC9_74365 [bioreactor metagenome]|uniref:Uncharacterized protein n=1 Tax=bioreactor metagenome TaxID=1076179 RepID=A0A644YHB7_9ZZZZ